MTMLLVQNFRRCRERKMYDFASRAIASLGWRKGLLGRKNRIDGFFCTLGGKRSGDSDYPDGPLVVLFRYAGHLWVDIGEFRTSFESATSSAITVAENGEWRTLQVTSAGKIAAELCYQKPLINPALEDDPTSWGVDETDFDLGLFLEKVANDRDLQAGLFVIE